MRLLLFITFNVFIFGCVCYGTEKSIRFRDYNLLIKDKTNDGMKITKCSSQCSNDVNSRIMVQTAAFNLTDINTPIVDNRMAIVYYRCGVAAPEGGPKEMQYHSFQRLCYNRIDHCKKYFSSFSSNWSSINRNEKQVLNVNLQIPDDINELQIKTRICVEESTIFSFMIDNQSINYNSDSAYKYDGLLFSTTKLNKSPIKLSISKYPNENIADVVFNITRSKCRYGWHEVSDNDLGYMCFLTIDNSTIEGGYKSLMCRSADQETVNKYGNDVCQYYMSGGTPVCKSECYNMPNCSYLCAVYSNGRLEEGGYVMNNSVTPYTDVIGSGRWSQSGLPIDLVLFNECQSDVHVCQLGNEYCRDNDVSFSCTQGSYDIEQCLANKDRSPYLRCPADETALTMIVKSPSLIGGRNNSVYYAKEIKTYLEKNPSSISSTKLIFDMVRLLNGKPSNTSFNLPPKEKRTFASFLFRTYVRRVFALMDAKRNAYSNDTSVYAYRVKINTTVRELDIKMAPIPGKGDSTQFVKVELKPAYAQSNNDLSASYIQYNEFDVMNETGAIERNLDNMSTMREIKISPDDYPDEDEAESILYKNSDMFSFTVSDMSSFKTIRFKLPLNRQLTSPSWAYKVENKCGYLVEDKDWAWSSKGCTTVENGTDYYCECNHLSNFAMLGSMREINRIHLAIFGVMSIVGGVINIVSLSLFLIFILFINSREKLRIDQLNIASCLLFGTVIFLCGYWSSRNDVLCALSAITSQFLFLAAFVWKLILGINVVRLIASLRYQNEDWMVKYKWVMFATGYIVPLVIVIGSGSAYWSYYGVVADNVCWIHARSNAFLTFLIPVCIIIALNIVGLFFIANTLIRNYINTRKTRMNESNELVVFIQLLVSMGLTWTPLYFAIAYLPAMYCFVIFFPLQGLLMFLLVVIINKENREKVSSFFINSYHTITSKSTSGSEAKANSKSKSTGQTKSSEEGDNLLTGLDRTGNSRDRSEDRLLVVEGDVPRDSCVTKC